MSEAIYLDDPEGNGIEVYRDRLPEEWRWNGDRIQMATDRLDLDNLAAEAGNTAYAGAPDGLRIGHIHLRVGDLGAHAEILLRRGRPQSDCRAAAARCSCHPGAITITSAATPGTRPAPDKRDDDRAGLSWFAIEAAGPAELDGALARLKSANVPLTSSAARCRGARSVWNPGAVFSLTPYMA